MKFERFSMWATAVGSVLLLLAASLFLLLYAVGPWENLILWLSLGSVVALLATALVIIGVVQSSASKPAVWGQILAYLIPTVLVVGAALSEIRDLLDGGFNSIGAVLLIWAGAWLMGLMAVVALATVMFTLLGRRRAASLSP
ncbi:hypothetical protein BJH93_06810 [Kocuria polaris]|nr:hypothetical protein [Kocuria polaris]